MITDWLLLVFGIIALIIAGLLIEQVVKDWRVEKAAEQWRKDAADSDLENNA